MMKNGKMTYTPNSHYRFMTESTEQNNNIRLIDEYNNDSVIKYQNTNYTTIEDINSLSPKKYNTSLGEIRNNDNELSEKNKQLKLNETTLNNYKKKISQLKDKFSNSEKSRIELNFKVNQLINMADENALLKDNLRKLSDELNSKNLFFSQSKAIVDDLKRKFNLFEDANKRLKNQNEQQNKVIVDLKKSEEKKDKFIKELMAPQMQNIKHPEKKTENKEEIDKVFQDHLINLEKRIKNKYLTKEEDMRKEFLQLITDKNLIIEDFRIENEKLKLKVNQYDERINELESTLQIKELEIKKISESNEREQAKLMKSYNLLQKEVKEIEKKYIEQLSDSSKKLKDHEDINKSIKKDLTDKAKIISDLGIELNKEKESILNLNSCIMEMKTTLDIQHRRLDTQNKEIKIEASEVSKRDMEIRKLKEVNLELTNYQSKYFNILGEKEELNEEIFQLRNHVNKSNEIIDELRYYIEEIGQKHTIAENDLKSQNEKNQIAYRKKIKAIEDKYCNEMVILPSSNREENSVNRNFSFTNKKKDTKLKTEY